MKKKIIYVIGVICLFLIICALFFNFNRSKKNKKLEKVKLAEVAHTIFYAPMYASIENGYFKEEGIDLELTLTPGADKVSASVLSGDVDIGFSGSEATIYVYNSGEKDYLKTFAALTQKDGSFIVSRNKTKKFKISDLKGKTIIGGRIGGMPEMMLEWALKQKGLDPVKDVNIDTSVAFPAMSGSFIGGNGDYVSLFEPTAMEVEKQGYGYVVASLGEISGNIPYTSYYARKSYIKDNKDTIKGFDKAIQKGLDFVNNSSDLEVAKAIQNQFPDTSLNDLKEVIKRYRKIEAWPKTTELNKKAFDHMQEIMISANQLKKKVNYKDLVYEK